MKKYIIVLLLFITLPAGLACAQTIGGIGAQLFLDTAGGYTMPRIQSLVARTPAYDSLKATDYIMKVNDISCKDKTMQQVVEMIRGEVGTTVKIIVADTKEGKRPRTYNLARVSIQSGPPPDPIAVFNDDCENEIRLIRQKHFKIIKTFPSDCGNYFFNFEAETDPIHVRVMTMEEKGAGAFNPGFYPSAKVFDTNNETDATELTKTTPRQTGSMYIAQLEGQVSFKRPLVATVSITIHDDATKCKGMYVVVYK